MNEQNLQAYIQEQKKHIYMQVIDMLLNSPDKQASEILQQNQELIDADFIETMEQVAAEFDSQENSKGSWLRNIAQSLTQYPYSSRPSQVYFDFLSEILRTISSGANQEQVYLVFQRNLDKLNLSLAQALQIWADNTLPNIKSEPQQAIGYDISLFSNLIGQFPLGSRQNNLEIAITGYNILLTIYTQQEFPQEWAVTNYNLSIAYTQIIKGDGGDNLEKAIAACEDALTIYTQQEFPQKWAVTKYNLSIAYTQRIKGDRGDNLEKAIAACEDALTIYTQEEFSQEWAGTNYSLGTAYTQRIKGDRGDNLECAIAAYKKALTIYTQEEFSQEWAMTNYKLGTAHDDRIKEDRANNLECAIAAYKKALIIYTQQKFPKNWAMISQNIGAAYTKRIKGDRGDNLERAIAACEDALTIYTQQEFPQEWAMTQNNLASVYSERIAGDRNDNLECAIAIYQQVLTVHTQQSFPVEWATTQNNLASVYSKRIAGDRSDNLERAIVAYQKALIIRTQRDLLVDWAATQNNLASVYIFRIVEDRSDNLERAIACCNKALRVYNEADFSQAWAVTQNNLGVAYSKRIVGNRSDNLDLAIECFQNALKIFIPKADPIQCLDTSKNLGNLALEQKRWQLAIDAYATAIEAVEISRQSASNNARKQEILSDAISVYVNMARACIQDGQYVRAIEYLERSKTRNLVDLLTERQMYPRGKFPQEIIDSLDALRRNLIAAERRLQQQKTEECFNRLASLRQSMEYLLRTHIQPVDPSFQLSQRVEPISFAEIQAALPTTQTALIEWCVSKDTFTTFIVTKNRTQPLVITKDFEEVQTLTEIKDKYLSKYREYKEKWQERLILFLYQLARTLEWDEVIESLKQVLPDCNRIILVPHRWLHIIPIHALPLKDGRCLLDLFPQGVSYAPSVQLLELTQKEVLKDTGDKEDREDKKFFAVQNPTEDPALPYTNVEVAAIRKQFQPHDDVLVGKEGHRQALTTERLRKANYTHFSCHGTFNFEKPEHSALLLADSMVEEAQEDKGEKEEKEDRGDRSRYLPSRDGSYIDLEKCLTLGEIFGLDLRNCRLVTLSACETGLTDIKNLSDEYIGLPSGFLYAGSPSVVSSLWAVSDLSTTFLMIKFYQNLQTMDSVPVALNQAQLWLRGVTKEELTQWKTTLDIPGTQKFEIDSALRSMPDNSYPFAAPSHWAAFCAVGS